MSDIEWTDETVNLAVGCTRVSPGCVNCYAERFVHRGLHEAHRGLTVMRGGRPGWDGTVRFLPERLDEPQRWKRGRRIFINSLSDTFHGKLAHEQRAAMFGAFLLAPHHSYQILTKRPEVAVDFERWLAAKAEASKVSVRAFLLLAYYSARGIQVDDEECAVVHRIETGPVEHDWWIGVTAEDQKHADERIPHLLSLRVLPTRRFVSYEPALGPVSFRDEWLGRGRCPTHDTPSGFCSSDCPDLVRGLDWIVVGGESGPGARPFDVAWARGVIAQCREAGVACFLKQAGARPMLDGAPMALNHGKGADLGELPEDLRVRQWPEVTRG